MTVRDLLCPVCGHGYELPHKEWCARVGKANGGWRSGDPEPCPMDSGCSPHIGARRMCWRHYTAWLRGERQAA